MKKTVSNFILLLLVPFIFSCCEKHVESGTNNYPLVEKGSGVFILNEGNYTKNNASVSYYNKTDKENFHHLFWTANGENPGDLLNSMVLHEGNLWLVLNNSGKIEAMDPETGNRTAAIQGFASPRHLLPLNGHKAYVSDLFDNRIHVLDLNTHAITGHIPMNGWTEAILKTSDRVIVSGVSSGRIYSINPTTDLLTDSLYVGHGPASMVLDKNDILWILCEGNYPLYAEPSLVKVDPVQWKIIETYNLPVLNAPWSKLTICDKKENLYFLGGDVYIFETTNQSPREQLLISGQGMNLYGLGVDPQNGEIYVSDAIDFVQQGMVMRYTPEGELLDSFLCRIIPGGFLFY